MTLCPAWMASDDPVDKRSAARRSAATHVARGRMRAFVSFCSSAKDLEIDVKTA
jgi:hypothetical protein